MSSVTKTVLPVLFLALAAGGIWWSQQQGPRQVDDVVVVASVNGIEITREEFLQEMAKRGGSLPGQYQTVEQRRALLDSLLERKALVEGALLSGYDQDPEIVARYEDMLARKFRENMLKLRLEAVTVSDQEVEEFYEQHKEDYARPARRQVALIHVAVPGKANEEAWAKKAATMDEVLAAVQELPVETRHFGLVARKYSDDRSSRYRGGVIGWLVEHPSRDYKWDMQVIEAAFALQETGQISAPLKTDDGYYLVRLVQKQDASLQPLDRLREGLRNRLLTEKRRELQRNVMDEIHRGMEIEVNEPVLAAIEPLSGEKVASDRRTPPAIP